MDGLLYARAQMGLSLAFHIVFAAAGIALPLLMVLSDALYLKTRAPEWKELSIRLAKGTAILFAVGAVSGTVLSFELGLLWPTFMGRFGELVALPFALEGIAFFTEAVFLGLYLYGRERLSPALHLFSGAMVALSGAASACFVTLVNAFMNNPRGFELSTTEPGKLINVDPVAAMFSPAWTTQVPHVLLSCYAAVGFAMAGIHAWMLLRGSRPEFHRRALGLALVVGGVAALLQPLSGDVSAKHLAKEQPIKLAAMEGHFVTGTSVPIHVGGWPDVERGETRYALELPYGLSFLAFADFHAEVKGLLDFPRSEWPPVASTHLAFTVMVGGGVAMMALAALAAFLAWRTKAVPVHRRFLQTVVGVSPLGLIAMEAGWLVTELGRQPWIVRGAMRTSEAVTPFPHLAAPFGLFTLVYLFLGVCVFFLLRHQVAKTASVSR